jgi:hypothetical protein
MEHLSIHFSLFYISEHVLNLDENNSVDGWSRRHPKAHRHPKAVG